MIERQDGGRVHALRGLKAILAVVAAVTGLLLAGGTLLAARFELDGFGRPRDTPVRTGYLIALAFALIASLALPTALAWWASPRPARPIVTGVGIAMIVLGICTLLAMTANAFL